MTYSFHPDAELELNASVDYYEECKTNLGSEFAYEVQKTIQRILVFPTRRRYTKMLNCLVSPRYGCPV
jgi:hypothetical protein